MATSAQLRREILAGQWDEALSTLYGTEPAVLAPSGSGMPPRWNSLSFTMAPGGRDRKSTRLNSSHRCTSRMPSSA